MAFHKQLGSAAKSPFPGHNYFVLLSAFVLAVSIIFTGGSLGAVSAAFAASAVSQCNGVANVGGQGVTCTVVVTNTLNLDTGVGSSVVTVEACEGAANTALTCTTTTTPSNDLVTVVDQCNGSGNGGGSTVECSVTVVNNITGTATAITGTVNQCNTSGQGGGTEPTVICNPLGSTTNATITQCNGSGNGGGGTARVLCTVGLNNISAALPITVNQCNVSGNGGGGTVTCTSSVETTITVVPPVDVPPVDVPPVDVPPVDVPPVDVPPVDVPPVVTPVVVPAEVLARTGGAKVGKNAGMNVQTAAGTAAMVELRTGSVTEGTPRTPAHPSSAFVDAAARAVRKGCLSSRR